MSASTMFLSICQCPKHPKFWSVSVDDKDGCGTRVTPSKCCGTWNVVRQWKLSAADWAELAELASNAAEEAP